MFFVAFITKGQNAESEFFKHEVKDDCSFTLFIPFEMEDLAKEIKVKYLETDSSSITIVVYLSLSATKYDLDLLYIKKDVDDEKICLIDNPLLNLKTIECIREIYIEDVVCLPENSRTNFMIPLRF